MKIFRLHSYPIFWIVICQLLATSLWFSANSAAEDLRRFWNLKPVDIGWLTNAVQAGFIIGTLCSAITGLTDRYSASKIFCLSALCGAAFNLCFAAFSHGLASAMAFRFLVGVALAGIYPVGMKLIVTYRKESAGKNLGLLVGMLTLGTALPHGIRMLGASVPWQMAVSASSVLALFAAIFIGLLGDGPHSDTERVARKLRPSEVLEAFKIPAFRSAAFGYFGHMWELYAFWALVPALLNELEVTRQSITPTFVPGWSFTIIAIGFIGSVVGGQLSSRLGSARVASSALCISGLCCAAFPILAHVSDHVALATLLLWGLTVIADSPQFSALSISACPTHLIGSALAIQNSIGFAITTVSIFVATDALPVLGFRVAWLLGIGPLLGLLGMLSILKTHSTSNSSVNKSH